MNLRTPPQKLRTRPGPSSGWADQSEALVTPTHSGYKIPLNSGYLENSRMGLLAHPLEMLKRIFQTVFRTVPYPTKPGLVMIGHPGRNSPVLITTNYQLTVRHVVSAISGKVDCYLLVAPAGGLDVWCAAGGNRFTIDSIISILNKSRIGELVDHRRLVLPELCANGIDMFEVKRRTGWTAVFGPVRAEDIPEYLRTKRKTETMMRVTFDVGERLEMATAMWGSLSLRYTLFPALIFFGWTTPLGFVLILAALAASMALGCFVLPGKTFVQKASFLWVLGAAAVLVGELFLGGGITLFSAKWILLLLAVSYLVGTAFPSYSPLWQCGYSKLFFGYPNLQLVIIEERCIGCNICDQVCPVECFAPTDNRKIIFAKPELCEGCNACLVQCPTDAIINEVAVEHQRLAACG